MSKPECEKCVLSDWLEVPDYPFGKLEIRTCEVCEKVQTKLNGELGPGPHES